jgi:hypothetical protein
MIHRTSLPWFSAAGAAVIALTCAILATRDSLQGLGSTGFTVAFWAAFVAWALVAVVLRREHRRTVKPSR